MNISNQLQPLELQPLDSVAAIKQTEDAGNSRSAQTANTASTNPSAYGDDRTSLSASGQIIAQSTTDPVVRLDKVTAIQNALAQGTYSVSNSDIAAKLVDQLLER